MFQISRVQSNESHKPCVVHALVPRPRAKISRNPWMKLNTILYSWPKMKKPSTKSALAKIFNVLKPCIENSICCKDLQRKYLETSYWNSTPFCAMYHSWKSTKRILLMSRFWYMFGIQSPWYLVYLQSVSLVSLVVLQMIHFHSLSLQMWYKKMNLCDQIAGSFKNQISISQSVSVCDL